MLDFMYRCPCCSFLLHCFSLDYFIATYLQVHSLVDQLRIPWFMPHSSGQLLFFFTHESSVITIDPLLFSHIELSIRLYRSSTWALKKLHRMLECRETNQLSLFLNRAIRSIVSKGFSSCFLCISFHQSLWWFGQWSHIQPTIPGDMQPLSILPLLASMILQWRNGGPGAHSNRGLTTTQGAALKGPNCS